MTQLKVYIYLALLTFLNVSCAVDSAEELLLNWQVQDSLLNKVPQIQILSPLKNDTVEVPFSIEYQLTNWEITENGNHIQYFIEGQNKGQSYSPSTLTITESDTGQQKFMLQLLKPDFTHVPVSDEVLLYVKPIPEATYPLIVNNGTGSGNYIFGEIVVISAGEPPTGQQFLNWTGDTSHIVTTNEPITTLVMPQEEVRITANFEVIPLSYSIDIVPIIEKHCLNCHTQLFDPLLNTCGELITHKVKVVERIQDSDAPMPPSGLLPQAEIDKILTWIAQEAACNN